MSVATLPCRSEPAPTGSASGGRVRAFAARRGVRELFVVAALYGAYDFSRLLVQGRQATALAHGMRILHLERILDIDPEQALNRIVSAHRLLAVPADYVYATLHYVVTPLVLVWMWRRHHEHYSRARTVLVVATLLGLLGFTLLPVAPPRMLPGFVDTMARYSFAGWWASDASAPRGIGALTNEFAAMPSLHVGWALWCGWQLWRHAQHRTARLFGVAYPVLVTLVVVATGNHYLLDAFAGLVVVGVAAFAVGRVAAPVRRTPTERPARVIDLSALEQPRARSPIP
jgi:PAP2 superfamily